MEKCLLSIDWDFFFYTRSAQRSCIENHRCLVDSWYKRYIRSEAGGEDIRKEYSLSPEADAFWDKLRRRLGFARDIKALVSDSHALSYRIAAENGCEAVLLFDAHADLGYGGLSSLDFEVNCSNWLGKLLKDKKIKAAYIFYSPYTAEKPEYFWQVNELYSVRYCNFGELDGLPVAVTAIHICRSGAWTPPWLDDRFYRFVESSGFPCKTENCPERKWDPERLSLSDRINYLLA